MQNKSLPSGQRGARGKKFLSVLCSVVGTLILLSVIVTCLPAALPRILGYEVYNVVSGSMEPEIPVGSMIYVKSVEADTVQEGDVIAFQSDDSVITHRVMKNKIVEGKFTTKGDANAQEDMNDVPYSALIGSVTFHCPFLGELLWIYTSTAGKAYAICFAACGVMFHILAKRMRERTG